MIQYIKPIGIFQQAAASLFAYFGCITHFCYRFRYILETQKPYSLNAPKERYSTFDCQKSYPFLFHWTNFYHFFWILAYLCASLFHLHDTILTERLDYFSAMFALIVTLNCSIFRIFWITNRKIQFMIFLPFFLFFLRHSWWMHYSKFDYGYHVNICSGFVVAYLVLWWFYLLFRPKKYFYWFFLHTLALLIFVQFELNDYPVLFEYFDSHGLWHGSAPFIQTFFHRFIIEDSKYYSKVTFG